MKLAILIPAYNAAETLRETLESIGQQTPHSLQQIQSIVVADDGSSDTTCEIAERFAAEASLPIETWRSEVNRGERATVNDAFRRLHAAGFDWCFVIHADDVAKPNWLDTLWQPLLKATPEVVSICSSWDDWYPPHTITPGENAACDMPRVIQGSVASAIGTLHRGCWWHFSGCAMQLATFFRVGPFIESMPQLGDLEWLIRSELNGVDTWYVPRSLILYRQSANNVSSISFRTNRDLKEKVAIIDLLSPRSDMREAVAEFAYKQTRVSLKRTLSSIWRCQFQRARSAWKLAGSLSVRWLRIRSTKARLP